MAVTDKGYIYLYNCDNEECSNANGYWHIYDQQKFIETIENQ